MTESSSSAGPRRPFFAHRDRLLRFFIARGAGDAAEDLLQEIWLKISMRNVGPVSSPLSYLFRTADTLMIDQFRSARQTQRREREWSEANGGTVPGISDLPSAERHLIGREQTRLVVKTLDALGSRPAAIFCRHRVDGISQRLLAEEFGVSPSTVESDLRRAYTALAALKESIDEV